MKATRIRPEVPGPPRRGPPRSRDAARRLALEAAETGIARVIGEAWAPFGASASGLRTEAVLGLDGRRGSGRRLAHRGCPHGTAVYDAGVVAVNPAGRDEVDLHLRSVGTHQGVRSSITCVVRFGLGPSAVFDHAYFVDGYTWLRGAGLTIHGDVASNGDIDCQDVRINGDLRAARNPALGSFGDISGWSRHDSLSRYRATAGHRARPSSPTADPADLEPMSDGLAGPCVCPTGYPGRSGRTEGQTPIPMPDLGRLEPYVALAVEQGGSLKVDGVLLTRAGRHRGDLLLEGTTAAPIVIHGPVVVDGDVVIRGTVRGQGTIYAARNVHIVGDVEYETPPAWPKPSPWPGVDDAANRRADALGLAARGSVVIGDYTARGWLGTTGRFLCPPFTVPYALSEDEADLGYASVSRRGVAVFDGDYTAPDGGAKTDGSPRRRYESTLADPIIGSVADPSVDRIDAILYADHLIGGVMGCAAINGAVVARDEAIVYDGKLVVSQDVRVHSAAFRELEIFLPRGPTRRLVLWHEGP